MTASPDPVEVISGTNSTDNNFGNFDLIDVTVCKYIDVNGDGDLVEDPLYMEEGGWEIYLNGETEVTEEGCYTFTEVLPGTYEVTEMNVEGWVQTYPEFSGYAFEAVSGEDKVFNFGNFQLGKISGYKFNDYDGNGLWEEEPALEGWTIKLWIDNGEELEVIAETVTDENGYYEFSGLEQNDYFLSEEIIDGWLQTSEPNIIGPLTIVSGSELTDNNFGNFQLGEISGYKWNDADQNGAWEEGEEALADWIIKLWVDNGEGLEVIAETVTDENGYYKFTDLEAENYYLSEELVAGWEQTYPNGDGILGPLAVISGAVLADNNFGNYEIPEEIVYDPVLTINKTVDPTLTNPGKTVTYTVIVENTGEGTAYNVTLSDKLPAGFTFVDSGEAEKTWELGNMEPGDSYTREYEVKVDENQPAGFYDNLAETEADNHEKISDLATVEVVVPQVLAEEAEPKLSIDKSVDVDWTNPGKIVNYTVIISNIGDAPALDVELIDSLPAGFTFVDTGINTHTWQLGDLVPDESKTITYAVQIDASVSAGTYDNLAVADADNADKVSDIAPVEVRIPVVLGDTGQSNIWYIMLGSLLVALGAGLAIYMRKYRQNVELPVDFLSLL